MKQPEDNKTVDLNDMFCWPDGTLCYRYELTEYEWKSDDYYVVYFGTPEWEKLNAIIDPIF